ncbi:MAG: hypothetical protein M3X11_20540 [Acidobacteriota bacterium]|nr:hypothetical protein [Acidobacteriota bacterium]
MKVRWKKLLAAPFVFVAAIVILLEDWLWDDLQRLAAAIGRLPIFRQIEALIVSLPPYASLAVFAAPSLLLLPVKLAALWLISHGQAWFGLLIVVAAKVAGTALVARIYYLTEPKLLLIAWFARLHARFVSFKARVYNAIKSTKTYQRAHRQYSRVRERFRRWRQSRKSFWRRRWVATIKLLRKPNQFQK